MVAGVSSSLSVTSAYDSSVSSQLPSSLKAEFDAIHRDRRGRYRCSHCRDKFPRAGINIDHRKPEFERPDLAFDIRNLDPLCLTCHKAKTAKEARRRARRRHRPRYLQRLVGLAAGLYLIRYGFDDLGAPTPRELDWAIWAVAGLTLALSVLNVVLWWHRKARPNSELQGAAERVVDLTSRATEAARAVVGARGEVVVSGDVPADFTVRYSGTGFEDHKDDKRLELVSYLSGKLGARLVPAWDAANDTVRLRRRPDLPARVEHPGFAADRPWFVIPLGERAAINLKVTSHVLITGVTNSGKTVVIRSIIEAFIDSGRRHGAKVRLGDPKMIELLGFRGLAGVEEIATSDEELWDLALDTKAEMDRRYTAFRDRGVPLDSHDPMLLVIDEYEEYVRRMKAYWPTLDKEDPLAKKPGMENPALEAMKSVLAMARKGHIHVVIGTQRPDAAWFGGSARDNLQGRVGVGRLTGDAARMAFGSSEFGRDVPATAKGRITVQNGDEEVFEDQAYWVPDRIEDLRVADLAILDRLSEPLHVSA